MWKRQVKNLGKTRGYTQGNRNSQWWWWWWWCV